MVNLFKNFLLSLGRRSLCSELWSWLGLQRSLPLSCPILFRQTPAVAISYFLLDVNILRLFLLRLYLPPGIT